MSVAVMRSNEVASVLRLRYARADAAVKRTEPAANSPQSHGYREHHEALGMRVAVRDLILQTADLLPEGHRAAFIDSCDIGAPGA
jgi:ppGpp synthetase/RelA/SpoT-type nucleotidyltranferase